MIVKEWDNMAAEYQTAVAKNREKAGAEDKWREERKEGAEPRGGDIDTRV